MQERLLLMSHYRLQQTLDMAPSMSQNSLAKMLMTADETTPGAKVHIDFADPEAPQKERRGD